MILTQVVAVARNRAIGLEGGLPWHLPGDLAFFKRTTMGKPILMGRRTWKSLPRRPLPGRRNVVVSRTEGLDTTGAEQFRTLVDALSALAQEEEVCVIGGATLYDQTLPLTNRLYLTEVHAEPEADTFFPDFDRAEWDETWREAGPQAPDGPAYDFVLLERRQS